MAYLETKNISKKFGKQTALNDISISIEEGELVCILGPSGCGKTTLLRIIAGLETASGGSIYIGGRDCTSLPPAKRNFGIVFQSYALFPNMTVSQNILFGLRQKKEMTKAQQLNKVTEVLEMVDLTEHKDKYPSQLSGGQQQRTALARAIALSPSYLLLDEPLSALDAKVRGKLRNEICGIQKSLKITTIMVTHDQEEALTMADRIIVMNNSVVEQIGTPREIYENPATPFVANFIGSMNFYESKGKMCAVRPENMALSHDIEKEAENMPLLIKDAEFKGALTRIYGMLPCQTEICVDLPSEDADKMKITIGETMVLNVMPENMIHYPVVAEESVKSLLISEAV